jgi:hypothetical protein
MRMLRRARLGTGAAGLALYALLAFASFLPLSLRPRDTVAYVGDSLESAYIVGWNVRQAFRAPARLFEANVLHPHRRALAFTDHRLLPSLVVAPVVWASGSPVLAANLSAMLACVLAAAGARRLARVLGAGAVAAWAAGALYGFHTYQVNEAPRLNIVAHGFIPFALAELVLFLRTGEKRRAWRTAAFMLLQGLSSNYHLLYGALVLGIVVLGALVAKPRATAARLPWLALAAAAAALAFAPIAIPYLKAARAHGYSRDLPGGIALEHYVSTTPTNLLYGAVGTQVRLQQRGPHFVGFLSLALALAAFGLWAAGRREDLAPAAVPARVWVPAAAALALLFVSLSLGRDMTAFGVSLGPGPYRALHRYVPGFQLVRIPERLALMAMLFVALLAARALTLAGARRPWLGVVLAALIPLEHLSTLPVSERVPVAGGLPEVYRWLARNPTAAVAEVPVHGEGLVREETLEMYFSTAHWKPIVHGYTAFPPLLTRHLRRLVARFPSAAAVQGLRRAGVDTVVVHHGRPLGLDLARRLRDTGQYDDERFGDLLRRSGQDLYGALPEAVASGRIRREARFEGPEARLFRSEADEVYRIGAAPAIAPAPFPAGTPLADPAWAFRAKVGDPRPAFDGDMRTAWVVPRALVGDEFLEVVFAAPVRVTGVVLRLRRDSAFPTRFRVAGLVGGRWTEIARFDDAHALQLLERLLADPREAAIGFDLGPSRELGGISLLVEEAGTSFEGWSIPEVVVLAR